MLGKLALIGTLGLCTAFGLEQRVQGPEHEPGQDPQRVIEELERRIERLAEEFEERFEQQVERLEEALEERLEAATEELEERIEALEEELEERLEQLEEHLADRIEWLGEERAVDARSERDCTPSRASTTRNCTPSRSLISRFQRAHGRGDRTRAELAVDRIVDQHGSDLSSLNRLAWELLTDEDQAGRHDDLAMALAERMLAQRERLDHYMKDTVALALFRAGQVREAIELQREAVAEGGNDSDYRRRLATYERALPAGEARRIH